MHFIAPGTYLDRAPDGSFTLSIEDVVVHDGKPLKLRIKRILQTEKLRAIVPELFPVSSPSIAEDVKMLRELIEWMKLPGQIVGGGEGADAALLIERVLNHYESAEDSSA